MAKIYLLIGVLSLSTFAWAQYRGVGLFDDTVNSNLARSTGQRNTFHK
jgi:hypothetical protein